MKKFFILLLILIIALFALAGFGLNKVIKTGIETVGTQVLSTKVSVGNVDVSPFSGIIKIKNIQIANPEGFEQPNIFDVKEIDIKVISASSKGDYWFLEIDKIIVDEPKTHNEVNQSGNNIAILKSKILDAEAATNNKTATDAEKAEAPKKPSNILVAIDTVNIKNSEVELTQNIIGSSSAKIGVENIKIRNIGTADQPLTTDVALKNILEKFFNSIVQTSKNNQIKSAIEGALGNKLGGELKNAIQQIGLEANKDANAEAPTEAATPEETK
jgi:hypothetical protein